MKLKDVLTVSLLIEAVMVLLGIVAGYDMWAGIICYWAVLSLKNLIDYIDTRRENDRRT